MQENILRLPHIAEKRTESAYKALHRKAVSVIASVLVVAEIALMLCFCALSAIDTTYLPSALILMTSLFITSVLLEKSKGENNNGNN